MDLHLERAVERDAVRLTQISIRAFHSDLSCGASSEGGPPGYDSEEWQHRVIAGTPTYKVLFGGEVVGGIIVVDQGQGNYNLARMFVDPDHQGRGIGLESVHLLFELYPDAVKWTLDTPAWNTRTQPFYRKLGFRVVGETGHGLLLFEKSMPRAQTRASGPAARD
jgi:GNAT superfamily N-acetyltransferase